MKVSLAAIVAASAMTTACDDKLLAGAAMAAGHDVTATVTESDNGKLRVEIQNGRNERISKPRDAVWLFMVDGVPTLDLGPREMYLPTGTIATFLAGRKSRASIQGRARLSRFRFHIQRRWE